MRRVRTPAAINDAREKVHNDMDRLLDALEFGYDAAHFRERLLDSATVYACEVATRRTLNEKRRGAA